MSRPGLPARLLAPLLGLVLLAGACSAGASTPAAAPTAVRLTVYAAASLHDVMGALASRYAKVVPGMQIAFSFDSSAALRTQIEQGAGADLFVSADLVNAQRLADEGLTAGPVVPVVRNVLTIVVPATGSSPVHTPFDLALPGVRVVAAGSAVPITKYATKLIANLAALPGAPPDFVAAVDHNIVSREEDVTAVLAKVALGEGDAGIVYTTDARSSSEVRTVAVPADANVPATYGAVVVKASPHAAAASAFLHWLLGSDAQSTFAAFGFLAPQ